MRWRVAQPATHRAGGVGQAQERDHVVLVDAVARDSDRADQSAIAVDRHRTRENLDPILQPVLAADYVRLECATLRGVGSADAKQIIEVLGDIADDQR